MIKVILNAIYGKKKKMRVFFASLNAASLFSFAEAAPRGRLTVSNGLLQREDELESDNPKNTQKMAKTFGDLPCLTLLRIAQVFTKDCCIFYQKVEIRFPESN